MFELRSSLSGEKCLFYVKRHRYPGETGQWVEVCHYTDKESAYFVKANREMGLEVEIDEHGMYRALVLKH